MKVNDEKHNENLPENYDLRQKYPGCFSPVENQGSCGSCWSFAISSTFSDAYAIMNAKANITSKCEK